MNKSCCRKVSLCIKFFFVKSMGSPFADDHGIMGKSHDFNIQLGGFHWLLIIIPIGIATTEGIPGHTQILVILLSY